MAGGGGAQRGAEGSGRQTVLAAIGASTEGTQVLAVTGASVSR